MKTKINGITYDTENADFIEEKAYSPESEPEERHFQESLWQTENGAYFLIGTGGGCSPYSASFGNAEGPGSGIVPLTDEEADEWKAWDAEEDPEGRPTTESRIKSIGQWDEAYREAMESAF